MRIFIFLLFFTFSGTVSAQTKAPAPIEKTIIGWFNYDSILHLMPGYKTTYDSLTEVHQLRTNYRDSLEEMLIQKKMIYDSLSPYMSPFIKSVKQKEIAESESQIKIQNEKLAIPISKSMESFEIRLTETARKIALEKNYSGVLNARKSEDLVVWASPAVSFADMTADLCAALGIK